MARAFNDASGHSLDNGAAVLTAVPITMACWFQTDDLTIVQELMSLTDVAASGNRSFELIIAGTIAGDPLRARCNGGTGASSTAGPSANTWAHACAVFSANNARACYLNGGNKGTEATTVTPTGINRTALGRKNDATADLNLSGLLAEAAIWNVALTDTEVAILALGTSPLLVRPDALAAYWPLIGRASPEIDRVGDFPLTVTGATAADHCRIIRARSGVRTGMPGAGAPPAAGLVHVIDGSLVHGGLVNRGLVF